MSRMADLDIEFQEAVATVRADMTAACWWNRLPDGCGYRNEVYLPGWAHFTAANGTASYWVDIASSLCYGPFAPGVAYLAADYLSYEQSQGTLPWLFHS